MAGLSRVDKAHPKVRRSKMFISLSLKLLIFSSSADFGTCDTAVDGLGAPGAQGAWTKLPRHFPR